jgi:hypothetical protein
MACFPNCWHVGVRSVCVHDMVVLGVDGHDLSVHCAGVHKTWLFFSGIKLKSAYQFFNQTIFVLHLGD